MGDNVITALVTIATGIIGLAAFAVIVSKNAQTPAVIQAGGNALGSDILAAVSPVSGSSPSFMGFGGNGL